MKRSILSLAAVALVMLVVRASSAFVPAGGR
jgi:hypothetical protein